MWKQMSPLAHPKGKTPSRSCNLRKGVFFLVLTVRLRLSTTSQSRFADSSPSRGASGETVHFAGTAKASPTRRGGTPQA